MILTYVLESMNQFQSSRSGLSLVWFHLEPDESREVLEKMIIC